MRAKGQYAQFTKKEIFGSDRYGWTGILVCFVKALLSSNLTEFHRKNLRNVWKFFICQNSDMKLATFDVFLTVLEENRIRAPFDDSRIGGSGRCRIPKDKLHKMKWDRVRELLEEKDLNLSDVEDLLSDRPPSGSGLKEVAVVNQKMIGSVPRFEPGGGSIRLVVDNAG